jgi:hypothetical protein
MKKNIEIKETHNFTLKIGDYEIVLSLEEALSLYEQLENHLDN